ncbi:MAG TPA: alpha/beta hydrolase [Candidatus Obscuribacterales bacterium]
MRSSTMKSSGQARVNGTSLYYEDAGRGEPILFSHGLLWNTTMWRAQMGALSGAYRCVAYDHRGQGRSADARGDVVDVETLCADAAALIGELGLGAVHFVGHSLGGFVGLRLAVRHPELVRSLVLISTSADAEPERNKPKYRAMNLLARWIGPRVVAKSLMPIVHGKTALNDPARRAEVVAWQEQLASNKRSIYRAANGVIHRENFFGQLGKIAAPTLVLTGDEDLARTMDESQHMVSGISGAKLVVLPHGGHMLPLEEPSAVTDAIRNFIQ